MLDLGSIVIDPAWALRIPPGLARRRLLLPFARVGEVVYVACADPTDRAALQAAARHLGLAIESEAAEPAALRLAIERVYGTLTIDSGRTGVVVSPDDPVALCDELLATAILRGASDLHFDTDREGVRVRLRVDGVLEDLRRLESSIYAGVLSRLKVLSGLDIAEKRAPQDGGFRHRPGLDGSMEVDIRTATLPTRHGEKLTLRLLSRGVRELSLGGLGMGSAHLNLFSAQLHQAHGLVVISGPTGSGKTTTLYAGLRALLENRDCNIVTVEDPVEYDVSGLTQVEVSSGEKLGFAKALRSVLRHDPDVIMVGEVRDAETADLAIKAALTGHLVLCTLHTNSAAGVLTRLVDMGVPRYLVAATWRLAVAQRLVRRLCPHCRRSRQMTETEAALVAGVTSSLVETIPKAESPLFSSFSFPVYDPVGCRYCAGRGYIGRVGLFELLPATPALARLVIDGADEAAIRAALPCDIYPTLRTDAIAKLRDGIVATTDVLAVLPTDI